MVTIKKGQVWKSKMGGYFIQITNKKTGNGHWNTKKLGKTGVNSHKVHERTLQKFYELQDKGKGKINPYPTPRERK